MFLAMNRNKRGMTLDPAGPKGREIVRKLVGTADVVVANLPPEVLRSLGLDLDSLRAVKPDIILTTVTAFGAGGPWSHKHGFDGIGQAMTGGAYLTGTPGAADARLGALGRLRHRVASRPSARWPRSWRAARPGRGQKVEGALLRTAVAFDNPHADRAGSSSQAEPRRHRQPGPDLGAVRSVPHQGRLDHRLRRSATRMFARWAKLMGEAHWLTTRASPTTWPAATTAR